jgi:hypothetical protein
MKKLISIVIVFVFLFSCRTVRPPILCGTLLGGLQVINVGTSANDHTGDPLRTVGQKVNANFVIISDSLLNRYTKTQVDNLINAIQISLATNNLNLTGTTTTQILVINDTVTLPYNRIKIGNYPVINVTAQNLNTLSGAYQNIQQVLNHKADANNGVLTGATSIQQAIIGSFSSHTKLFLDSLSQRLGLYYIVYSGSTQLTPDIPSEGRIYLDSIPNLFTKADTTGVPYETQVIYKSSDHHWYGWNGTKWVRLDN